MEHSDISDFSDEHEESEEHFILGMTAFKFNGAYKVLAYTMLFYR